MTLLFQEHLPRKMNLQITLFVSGMSLKYIYPKNKLLITLLSGQQVTQLSLSKTLLFKTQFETCLLLLSLPHPNQASAVKELH